MRPVQRRAAGVEMPNPTATGTNAESVTASQGSRRYHGPSGAEGRRQMPFFDLTEEETRGLAEFLRWADHTDLQGWPPTDAG